MKIKDVTFYILVCIIFVLFGWIITGPECLNGIFQSKKLRPNRCVTFIGFAEHIDLHLRIEEEYEEAKKEDPRYIEIIDDEGNVKTVYIS